MSDTPFSENPSLSFACGGWLYLYMFGVARALQTRKVDQDFDIAGCSAGALTGAGLVLNGNFDNALEYVKCDCVPEVYNSLFLWKLFQLSKYITTCLKDYCNLHKWEMLRPGRLQIATTRLPYLTAERVTSYSSQQDLYLSLMASAAVFPLASLVYRNNSWCLDGGITDFQPVIDKNTIRISPFYFADAEIKPSRWVPIWWAIVPPRSANTIDWLYRLGFDDGCRWIDNHYLKNKKIKDETNESQYSESNSTNTGPIYTVDPPKRPHPYDYSRRISLDRFLGYDLNELMSSYVSFILDSILVVLVVCILKPAALLLVYAELYVLLMKSIIMIIVEEGYNLSPMITLCTGFLAPNYYVIIPCIIFLYCLKIYLVGPSHPYHISVLYNCLLCISSLSLLSRFISFTLSRVETKRHQVLSQMSLIYRIVRHSL